MASKENPWDKEMSTASGSGTTDLADDTATRLQMQDLSLADETANANKYDINESNQDEDLPPAYQTATADQQVRPFKAADYVKDNTIHMLLAGSGSLATDVLPVLVDALKGYHRTKIRIVLDKAALGHLSVQDLLRRPHVDAVYTDDDWQGPNAHLEYELRSWLDVMFIAPCSLRIFRNMATLGGDDLLSTILQVFDHNAKLNPPGSVGRYKHMSIAPAMDSATWAHPMVTEYTQKLCTGMSQIRSPSGRVSWSRVAWPVGRPDAVFDCFGDNCNMNIGAIIHESKYQLDKFRKGHPEYSPGK